MWMSGDWVGQYRYSIEGTPCEEVINACRPVHVPENVVALYPDDHDLEPFGAVSYLGVPLVDPNGIVLGNLAVFDCRPMPENPQALAIIQIFAARAAAEIARTRAERELNAREEQIRGLVDSALDAIVQLDSELNICRANPAAETTFGASANELSGQNITKYFSSESASKLNRFINILKSSKSDTNNFSSRSDTRTFSSW
jgi:GAF domain-containing protein